MDVRPDATLDARGLLCPLPVLRARKCLLGMMPGDVLAVVAHDLGAKPGKTPCQGGRLWLWKQGFSGAKVIGCVYVKKAGRALKAGISRAVLGGPLAHLARAALQIGAERIA